MAKINYIKIAKKSSSIQINELKKINKIFNSSFGKAVEALSNCKGKVICAGVGKSGLIARKVSATLSSIGVSSFFCDPGTARHGDMGQIEKKDILLIFSYSGNSEELNDMLFLLPKATNVVFNLFAIDGFSHKEISEKLGITTNTSKWHVKEARKKLKTLLIKKQSLVGK